MAQALSARAAAGEASATPAAGMAGYTSYLKKAQQKSDWVRTHDSVPVTQRQLRCASLR